MDIFEQARKEFEKTYDSKMTIEVYEKYKDGPYTKEKWVQKLVDEPCRLSRGTRPKPVDSGVYASGDYQPMIYFNPSLEVPPGSRITIVERTGESKQYKQSGEVFSYRTHKEMPVVREVKA